MKVVTYGLGGWCEECDESHDHPFNNIVGIEEFPDPPQQPLSGLQLVAALNAALGLWTPEEASVVSGASVEALVAEVQAWAVAASSQPEA